jgi:hypothetical protein
MTTLARRVFAVSLAVAHRKSAPTFAFLMFRVAVQRATAAYLSKSEETFGVALETMQRRLW